MTEPYPVLLKPVDTLHEVARGHVDSLLTQIVTELQAGEGIASMPRRLDVTLVKLTEDEVLSIAVVAVSRLARMHHAVEQLADKWQEAADDVPARSVEETLVDCTAELRKLVDDHG